MTRLHFACLIAMTAIAGCGAPTKAVPDNDSEAIDFEEPPAKEDAKKERPKLEPADIPDRLLEPSVQEFVDQISARGGSTQSELGKVISVNLANTRIDDLDLRGLLDPDEGKGPISKDVASIQSLTLSNTKITDRGISYLKKLKNLRQLHCEGTSISDAGMESIVEHTELWNLRLSRTKVGDTGLKNLTSLKKLEILSLDDTRVTDAGLETLLSFPLLETVNLSGTNVTDRGLEALKRLKTVNTLYLERTKVTKEGVQELRAALGVRCKIFAFDGTFVP